MFMSKSTFVSWVAVTAMAVVMSNAADHGSSDKPMCAFRPVEETMPLELTLPSSSTALTHPSSDLPLMFHGIHPTVVTRRTIPMNQPPKVTVTRYSGPDPPHIEYDDVTETVTIKSTSCAVSDGSTTPSSTSSSTTSESSGGVCTSSSLSNRWTTIVGAAAVAALSDTFRPVAAGLALFAGMAQQANAQEDESCMPAVEVVVEAPASYQGFVEVCLEEIGDSAICPDPFPTYETCDDPAPTCKVAVVGGGTGGLYTALRLVDAGVIEASDVCVFEATERVGGRLISLRGVGEDGDMTVDLGGYRTWPEFTPTAHALITEYLGIPMDCYVNDAAEGECEVFNIVDSEGKKAGFTTFVETMMQRLSDGGACFYPYHELVEIEKRDATPDEEAQMVSRQTAIPPLQSDGKVTELTFSNGVTATATWTTILNIPQRPLLNIVRKSNFDTQGLVDAPTLDALHSVQTVIAQKLYLYYPRGHVFWRKLGIVSGEFELEGDARNMLLAGRYHDGPVYCDDESDPNTCHGFLLATYTNDLSGNRAQYFRRYQRDRPEPITIFTNQDLEGAEFLRHAHSRLSDFHQLFNTDANYTGFEAAQVFNSVDPPPYAFLSTWNTAVPWAGGAWHSWTELENIDRAIQPFVQHNLFVVNEAYSLLQGWAEGAVKVADEILEEYFDVARPWDFERIDVNQLVRQTNSEECVVQSSSTESSGGSVDSGGSGSAADAILCFAADSLVEMADGTTKPIQEVRKGDFVATGMDGKGLGSGLVTEALYHPVGKEVDVAVVNTPFGELVGTPDHPVYWSATNEWMELQDLQDTAADVSLSIRIESRYVDAFYNLEVDGNVLGKDDATHSYVVHGLTASGLGDHAELNRLYPRQKHFRSQEYQRIQ